MGGSPDESGPPWNPAILMRSRICSAPVPTGVRQRSPGDADCRNRDQVIRLVGQRASRRCTSGGHRGDRRPGTLLVGLDVSGTPAAREAGGTARRWQVLTVNGDRIIDIRGFGDRTEAAARAGVPA